MGKPKAEMTGKRFNMLTVIREGKNLKGRYVWCRCDCGNMKEVFAKYVRNGTTKSCGCLGKTVNGIRHMKHSQRGSYIYSTWKSMKIRCLNEDSQHYKSYGGRGISIHDNWIQDFPAFSAYITENLGDRPEGYSLDRINNDGNYEPDNIRWASKETQARNKRSSVILTIRGESHSVIEWAELIGIKASTIHARLKRGWTPERAISGEVQKRVFKKEYKDVCLFDLAKGSGIKYTTILRRLDAGRTLEEALTSPVTVGKRTAFGETLWLKEHAAKFNMRPQTLSSRLGRGIDLEEAILMG